MFAQSLILRRCQVSTEYLIVIGFVTFVIAITLLMAYSYSGLARDKIALNQIEVFANKIIRSSESVFYAGEPSLAYISAYLPSNAKSIEILDYEIAITISTSSGEVKRAFPSKVRLQGSISATEGTKKIRIQALQNAVIIS